MRIQIRNLRLGLDAGEKEIQRKAARKLKVQPESVQKFQMVRKAVDARKKEIFFTYTVEVELSNSVVLSKKVFQDPDVQLIREKEDSKSRELKRGSEKMKYSPLIVGSGPAGLFCGLLLARFGYAPVIIEQGMDVDTRVKEVETFRNEGKLSPFNNIQFGEGGAGSFSDGKLTARNQDERVRFILQTLVDFGAPEEIIWEKKPHIGTDVIREVVKNIRREIIRLGGEIWFSAQLTDIIINQGALEKIQINGETEIQVSEVILAIGHSARNVYRFLHQKGVQMTPKAFAVGVRLEHPQDVIDKMQYGISAGHPALGAADYSFTYQDKQTGRSAYTFCMCPGGEVIAAASEPGQVVVNGMSYKNRDSGISNSAVVVTVSPKDWDNEILGGVCYQEELEQKAFVLGGGNYRAPAQYLKDFMEQKASFTVQSSLATYRPGVTPANFWELLPEELAGVLCRAILFWGEKAPELMDERAVMTGVETRTSAPLRIVRDKMRISVNLKHLYPCGEGAGYAGGIVSAAVDGMKTAEKIITTFGLPEERLVITDKKAVQGSRLE